MEERKMNHYAVADTVRKKILMIKKASNPYEIMRYFADKNGKTLEIPGTRYSIYEIYEDKLDKIQKMKNEVSELEFFRYVFIFSSSTVRFSLK